MSDTLSERPEAPQGLLGAEPAADRARIVFLVRVPLGRTADFLNAYQQIRHLVADGTPGHLVDQLCRSDTDPEQWLITSEWRDMASFRAWESSEAHRELVRPLREAMTEARSLRFSVRAQTSAGEVV
ncbi:antibiotic biosynthesis monooxygenase family protein [Streptomyces sp. NPDC006602]|uniref:antibiotic biosynthesis monooxygenase family protein n=1 Tax=Streptomyces sp. NPDC006602 TaxID=3364751 RepID=UPI0036C47109